MTTTRTKRATPPSTSSADTWQLSLPERWEQLPQRSLREFLTLLAQGLTDKELTTRLFYQWAGATQLSTSTAPDGSPLVVLAINAPGSRQPQTALVPLRTLVAAIMQLEWLTHTDTMPPVRLDRAECGREALDPQLHRLTLGEYILADRAHQQYAATHDAAHAHRLCTLLYQQPTHGGKHAAPSFTAAEMLGATLWFSAVKRLLTSRFPDLLRPAAPQGQAADERPPFDPWAHQQEADNMVRLLTGGDITKEEQVLGASVWRALTELNAKAREARQLRRQKPTA